MVRLLGFDRLVALESRYVAKVRREAEELRARAALWRQEAWREILNRRPKKGDRVLSCVNAHGGNYRNAFVGQFEHVVARVRGGCVETTAGLVLRSWIRVR